MVDIVKFRENAQSKGVCDEYVKQWDSCVSKRELFALACRLEPATYLVKSMNEGWGVSPEYIKENFPYYINGQYKASIKNGKGNDYTSQIWCCAMHQFIIVDTTLCIILGCNVDVFINDFNICRLIIDDASVVRLHIGEKSGVIIETHSYSLNIVENKGRDNVKIKTLR